MKKCMKYATFAIFLILCLTGIAFAETIEQKDSNQVQIGTILEDPETYVGQNVTFNGTISSQCGSGCWFIISDDTGDLYVTLRANNFVIPPAMGKKATVIGQVSMKGDVYVTGSQVIIGDTTYP
ncbi:hypothetical protein Mhun_2194 [Methanospirillum hungatei JF-1]|jgi:hypothetical protein|uniref:Nucleic acid binding, OB-fold, tRNA/helicase-type n=2 Tax=Methanospirillum TaxID=2202 RepID=Q2FU64_METHJ|nr:MULTISPECIES: hypothetical protein [Methanospirillum]MBP9007117.1 hypothetical protein [Methanospirillum sp.]ABD41899.1 hypothetical protein Mhun_2194 [Methanospirillum hungatei JF-1]MDX8548997.1 hypothetical protein [Methanospirillum hungatei]QVV88681.1 hypothetical protein KHC33_15390 [Methanospirillum sp. J.3.6.1-F.2.7.3]HOW03633.1 hypothetical protein [Methanospirillum hungatei]